MPTAYNYMEAATHASASEVLTFDQVLDAYRQTAEALERLVNQTGELDRKEAIANIHRQCSELGKLTMTFYLNALSGKNPPALAGFGDCPDGSCQLGSECYPCR